MLLLNKKLGIIILICSAFILNSCGKKKSSTEEQKKIDYENPEVVMQQAKNVLGENVKFAFKGKFDRDSVVEIAAGQEIKNGNEWGIKFELLKKSGNKLTPTFGTRLLNGSFKESLVKKIELPVIDYEMIYYNSQDYFLGSGGGEVYSYLINFDEGKAYYAHLITEQGRPVSLYLSDNIDIPEVKSYFLNIFKRDYPNAKVVSKDIVLKY